MGASSTFAANSINVTAGGIAPESGPSTPGTLTLTGNTLLGHSAILNYESGRPAPSAAASTALPRFKATSRCQACSTSPG